MIWPPLPPLLAPARRRRGMICSCARTVDPDRAAPAGYRVSALDIRRLSLFLAVVEHAGFTRAAHAVHISQPALSQAIAELEAELGGPLFHRLGRAGGGTGA